LQRGDAEVEQDAVNPRHAQPIQHCGQLVIDRMYEIDPVRKGGKPPARTFERLRIAVETDQPDPGKPGE
jgi:hypothetical protein